MSSWLLDSGKGRFIQVFDVHLNCFLTFVDSFLTLVYMMSTELSTDCPPTRRETRALRRRSWRRG